jgi:hypothetical protein
MPKPKITKITLYTRGFLVAEPSCHTERAAGDYNRNISPNFFIPAC